MVFLNSVENGFFSCEIDEFEENIPFMLSDHFFSYKK